MGVFLSTPASSLIDPDPDPDSNILNQRQCPTCFNQIFIIESICTQVGWYPFYTEGVYHNHNPNTTHGRWQCLQGHSGNYTEVGGRCPNCDYGSFTFETIQK